MAAAAASCGDCADDATSSSQHSNSTQQQPSLLLTASRCCASPSERPCQRQHVRSTNLPHPCATSPSAATHSPRLGRSQQLVQHAHRQLSVQGSTAACLLPPHHPTHAAAGADCTCCSSTNTPCSTHHDPPHTSLCPHQHPTLMWLPGSSTSPRCGPNSEGPDTTATAASRSCDHPFCVLTCLVSPFPVPAPSQHLPSTRHATGKYTPASPHNPHQASTSPAQPYTKSPSLLPAPTLPCNTPTQHPTAPVPHTQAARLAAAPYPALRGSNPGPSGSATLCTRLETHSQPDPAATPIAAPWLPATSMHSSTLLSHSRASHNSRPLSPPHPPHATASTNPAPFPRPFAANLPTNLCPFQPTTTDPPPAPTSTLPPKKRKTSHFTPTSPPASSTPPPSVPPTACLPDRAVATTLKILEQVNTASLRLYELPPSQLDPLVCRSLQRLALANILTDTRMCVVSEGIAVAASAKLLASPLPPDAGCQHPPPKLLAPPLPPAAGCQHPHPKLHGHPPAQPRLHADPAATLRGPALPGPCAPEPLSATLLPTGHHLGLQRNPGKDTADYSTSAGDGICR